MRTYALILQGLQGLVTDTDRNNCQVKHVLHRMVQGVFIGAEENVFKLCRVSGNTFLQET